MLKKQRNLKLLFLLVIFFSGVKESAFGIEIKEKISTDSGEQALTLELERPVEERIVMTALTLEKAPYVFGGNGQNGYDCSAFVQIVFRQLGVWLPRTASEQSKNSYFELVEFEARTVGDLVFFKNTYKKGVSHVGIMISPHYIVHASGRDKKIVVERLEPGSYLYRRVYQVKRLRKDYLLSPSVDSDLST